MSDQPHGTELWQAYNEQGEPRTDRGIAPSEAAKGILHGSAHVWLWRLEQGHLELLLQQRSANTHTWPEYFDSSAAGHVDFGETPLASARRETLEEIGAELVPEQFKLLFVYRQLLQAPGTDIVENELQWVYGVHMAGDQDIRFTDGEVKSSRWIDELALREAVAGNGDIRIVPHDGAYFSTLLQQIKGLVITDDDQ